MTGNPSNPAIGSHPGNQFTAIANNGIYTAHYDGGYANLVTWDGSVASADSGISNGYYMPMGGTTASGAKFFLRNLRYYTLPELVGVNPPSFKTGE